MYRIWCVCTYVQKNYNTLHLRITRVSSVEERKNAPTKHIEALDFQMLPSCYTESLQLKQKQIYL